MKNLITGIFICVVGVALLLCTWNTVSFLKFMSVYCASIAVCSVGMLIAFTGVEEVLS